MSVVALVASVLWCALVANGGEIVPKISEERVVFQIPQGEIEWAFFPEVSSRVTVHRSPHQRHAMPYCQCTITHVGSVPCHASPLPPRHGNHNSQSWSCTDAPLTNSDPWKQVAPVTSAHIFELVSLGMYTGNHFFRVRQSGQSGRRAEWGSGDRGPPWDHTGNHFFRVWTYGG